MTPHDLEMVMAEVAGGARVAILVQPAHLAPDLVDDIAAAAAPLSPILQRHRSGGRIWTRHGAQVTVHGAFEPRRPFWANLVLILDPERQLKPRTQTMLEWMLYANSTQPRIEIRRGAAAI